MDKEVGNTARRLKPVRVREVNTVQSDDLLARAAAGARDRYAFGELVTRHHSRVLGLLRYLARDRALADDLAAQTFLVAWEKLDSFRGDTSARFGAWLSRIAYREFLQRARRRKLERRIFSADAPPDVAAADVGHATLPASSVIVADFAFQEPASFTQLVSVCSQVQAETLYMNFVLELTHDEIALVTDRPLGTVKSHINRGKAAIRAALESGGTQPTSAQTARRNRVDE